MGPWSSQPPTSFVLSLLLLALVGSTVASLFNAWPTPVRARILVWIMAIASIVGVFITVLVVSAQDVPIVVVAPLGALVIILGVQAISQRRPPSNRLLAILAVAYLGLVIMAILTSSGIIDVELFVRGGLDALSAGQSPYAITIDNPYGPNETALFYGPGVVEDGRVVYGYPYLPATLLLDLPAHLVADAVWMHLAAMAFAIALAWRMATDQVGRAAVAMLALTHSTPWLILHYWIEPVIIGFFTLTVWGLTRGRRWAVVMGLAMVFSSKQYAVFFLPAVWPVLRTAGLRTLVAATALGCVIVGGFVMMDPHAFFRSVVELQLLQPFREDSISLLPGVQAVLGDLPNGLLVGLPFVGIAVSGVVAWRTESGPTAFALCVGLGLLATVLVSKQAFVNYYMMAGSALLLAGVTWPIDDPVQTRDPLSQGSRGSRGMSKTR